MPLYDDQGDHQRIDFANGGSQIAPAARGVSITPSAPEEFDYTHINPSQAFQGNQGASELLGQLSRAQWEDWKARFAPRITQLAGMATDPNAAGDAAIQAKDAMGLAFDTSQTINDQNRQKYGISLTPAQQEAQDRQAAIGRSAATISAGNEARISALDRQQAILAGGMGLSNIPDRVMNQ